MKTPSHRESTQPVLYREDQHMNAQWGVALLVLATGLICVVAVVGTMHGRDAKPGAWIPIVASLALADVIAGIVMWTTQLVAEVRHDGLYVRLMPAQWSFTRIPLEGAASHRVVTYSAFREYGGWGCKRTRKGRAFTIRGDRGVRIDYHDGTHVLIGSEQPEQLNRAISALAARGV